MKRASARNDRERREAEQEHERLQDGLSKYRSLAADIKAAASKISSALNEANAIASRQEAPLVEVLGRSVGRDGLKSTRERFSNDVAKIRDLKSSLLCLELQKRSNLEVLNALQGSLCGFSASHAKDRMERLEFQMAIETMGHLRERNCMEEIRFLRRHVAFQLSVDSIVETIEKQFLGDGTRRGTGWLARRWETHDEQISTQIVALGLKEEELRRHRRLTMVSSPLLHTLSGQVPPGCAALIFAFLTPLDAPCCTEDYAASLHEQYHLYFQSKAVMSQLEEAHFSIYPDWCFEDVCGCPQCSGRDDLWLGPRKGEKDRELFWGSLQTTKCRKWCWGA